MTKITALHRPAIYWLILIATILRFHHLSAQSLWSDEGNSVALAQASFSDIATRTAFDIHPPFYYWLLKIWTILLGNSEFAVRSLSAMLGVLLVALIYCLGKHLFNPTVALTAATIATLSPFQIYYAQETRMYMLLTVLGTFCILLAIKIIHVPPSTFHVPRSTSHVPRPTSHVPRPTSHASFLYGGYIVVATLGLYTQYAFPVILAVINLAVLVFLWSHKSKLLFWIGLQLIPLIAYSPWLPTAYRQITTWPSLIETTSADQIALTLIQYLSLGISATVVDSKWLFPFIGFVSLGIMAFLFVPKKQKQSIFLLILWLLMPAMLTAILFRPAYLKFLLVASPAFCLLVGVGVTVPIQLINTIAKTSPIPTLLIKFGLHPLILNLLIVIPSGLSLVAAYNHPLFQRDNYRGIANFIQAVATKEDVVIIHAPGQQEVFGYYYHPGPTQAKVIPLPHQRPLDPTSTITELETISQQANRVYAVYWATEEADPTALIETWLNEHTYKASDTWFGNVRLVSYATPQTNMTLIPTNFKLGQHITLTGYSLSTTKIVPASILQLNLTWQTNAPLDIPYTVFIQLLDQTNHLVAQRDAFPLLPTTNWQPNQPIADRHGVVIQPGSPPGPHRLIIGLYDANTGTRLSLDNGQTFIDLATVMLEKNTPPLPREAFQMHYTFKKDFLLGYDLYKSGHASAPNTPLHPGDPLHLNLYWQKTPTLPNQNTIELHLLNPDGNLISAWQHQIAGLNYPPTQWTDKEIVKAQFDLFLSNVPPNKYKIQIVLDKKIMGETHWIVVE